MQIIRIDSAKQKEVEDYCLLKHKEKIRDRFIADHERTVLRLLESDIEVLSLFCTEKYFQKYKILLESKLSLHTPVYMAEENVFLETVGYPVHRGFLGVGKIPMDWELGGIKQSPPPVIIATNELADAENLGSIVRTATAFGIDHILTDPYTCSPFLRRCVRVSMGNIFYSSIRRSTDLLSDIDLLKEYGYKIIGLTLPLENKHHLTHTPGKIPFPDRFLLVLGNEANGIYKSVQEKCDMFITIPMNPLVDSLNVSHSLAVVLGQYQVFGDCNSNDSIL